MGTVEDFIATVEPARRRDDSRALLKVMRDATGASPVMWGSIVGFGRHHYRYESGREGDTVAVGFAARKSALALYGITLAPRPAEIERLGRVKLGKGCLYIADLSAVDTELLSRMTSDAYRERNNVS